MSSHRTYARRLQAQFGDLELLIEDLLLLEPFQIGYLPERAPRAALWSVLKYHPEIRLELLSRHPPLEAYYDFLTHRYNKGKRTDLALAEANLLWEIADLIIYNKYPEEFDRRVSIEYNPAELTDILDLTGKTVIDAGAGTGKLTFMLASLVREVIAVEPVGALRNYISDKSATSKVNNIRVLSGFLHDLPCGNHSVDAVFTSHAFGWRLADELAEIERVVRSGGFAIHLSGLPVGLPDHVIHRTITSPRWGYRAVSYREAGGLKQKYWKQITV
jgi:SAM-dependent methyltransferase